MERVMLYTERIRLVCSDLCEPDKARRQVTLRPLFDGYEVTADYPSCILMDDLLEMYPRPSSCSMCVKTTPRRDNVVSRVL
jgi:hypothetical protein